MDVHRIHSTEIHLTPADRVLVVAPHPDDEVLAAGGLLQHAAEQGAAVRVLYITRGENNPWAQRAHERRWRITAEDRERWARLRWQEALAALGQLGLSDACARSLAFVDQGLTDLIMSGGRSLAGLLSDEIAFWKPTLLLSPSIMDAHPDHSALSALTRLALERAADVHANPEVLEFLIHRPKHLVRPGMQRFTLTSLQTRRKRSAILCHQSQLHLRRRFLLGFSGMTETFHSIPETRAIQTVHPVRQAHVALDTLFLTIERKGLHQGRTALFLALESPRAEPVRLRIQFDVRAGLASLHDTTNGSRPVPTSMEILPDAVRFALPSMGDHVLNLPITVFAKLDKPRDRRIGFFDSAGWRQLDLIGSPGSADEPDPWVPACTPEATSMSGQGVGNAR